MKKINDSELKLIQLEILKDIHSFCNKHDIVYFLAYGSLIGAVRHKGYIPWDDDIDICMPRPDYERFIRLYNSEIYKLYCIEKESDCLIPYAKVGDSKTLLIENANFCIKDIGVNIDIFPIDGFPHDKVMAIKHYNKIKRLRNILTVKKVRLSSKRSIYRNFLLGTLKILFFIFSYRFILYKLMSLMKKYDYSTSTWAADLNWGDSRRIISRQTFDRLKLAKFEKESFYIPIEYAIWLKCIYGDFMSLPPVEKRITHHDFIAYKKCNM